MGGAGNRCFWVPLGVRKDATACIVQSQKSLNIPGG